MVAAWTFRTVWLLAFAIVPSGAESAGILPVAVRIVAQGVAHSEQVQRAEGQQRRYDDIEERNGTPSLHTNTSFKEIRETHK